MAFVKVGKTGGSKAGDPRNFTVKALPGVSFTISMDADGACKGFQVGGGRFVQVKTPANLINPAYLSAEVITAATAASDAVDKAHKAGKFTSVDKGDWTAWTYNG